MRRTLRQRLAISATAPLLAVTLAACGGDATGQTSDEKPVDASASASAETSGAEQPAEGEEVDADQFVEDMKAAMESAKSAHMTMEMDGLQKMSMVGDVDYRTDPPSMDARMSLGSEAMQFRLVKNFVYINVGTLSQGKFYKADINDPNSPLGDLTQLKESMDPRSSFDSFTEGLEKVTYQGPEAIGGTKADRYELTLDTTKIGALDDLTGTPGGAAPELAKSLTYHVWLDSADRMVKVELDMGKKLGTMVMTVSKWNEPVTVVAPPKAQVITPPMQHQG